MQIRAIATSALLLLLGLCVGGILLLQSVDLVPGSTDHEPTPARNVPVDSPTVAALFAAPAPETMADPVEVVQRVGPAVVTVINRQQARGGQLLQAGAGTGFIISDEGYIVTNQHVVEGGMSFDVILANGESRHARLVGEDRLSDLAVMQMEGPVPATVPLADSAQLQPGQRVLAIGSPLGAFTNTVTRGIVSAVDRDFPGAGTYANLVQHDAAINPGNSGGPLLNLAGQVVGVNTLGIQRNADGSPAQGLFFAVASN
ncbi:MAG: S1C family serine protease [Thermomicrobiales bacterium]